MNTPLSRRTFLVGAAATVSIVSLAPRIARAADDLHVAFVPEVATTPQSISAKQPFIDWLQRASGRTVNLIIPTNYAATVEAIGNGSVDLAHFGGLAYLKAAERYQAQALVQRSEDRAFHSLFITSSSDVKSLADVRGKSFAFGDVLSTSGHLIPAKDMLAASIDPDSDVQARFSGNHTNTAIAVNAGQVVAGALDETVYHKLVSDRTIDPQKARLSDERTVYRLHLGDDAVPRSAPSLDPARSVLGAARPGRAATLACDEVRAEFGRRVRRSSRHRTQTPPAIDVSLLVFENVVQRFGSRGVLAGIDLHIEAGERVALVGPSGAGKSTLFRLAYGAFAPTSGRVLIAAPTPGEPPIDPGRCDAKTLRTTRARIGVILQSHGLVDRLSVRANVIAGTFGRRTTFDSIRAIVAPHADEREAAREALAHVGLAERIDDRVFELSGGQRQRVAVARAIAQRAELVLADEPAASLDPDLARDIVALLLEDARERGTTLLCTLHQPELTHGFDRVIELRDGRARSARETTAA